MPPKFFLIFIGASSKNLIPIISDFLLIVLDKRSKDLFLIAFLFYIVVNLFKSKSGNKVEVYFYRSVFICLFINFFPIAPSGNFFNNYISMIYALPLGFMVSNMKIK